MAESLVVVVVVIDFAVHDVRLSGIYCLIDTLGRQTQEELLLPPLRY